MQKKVYIIWIGWIWISAIARYYLNSWYQVFGSDKTNSELIENLKKEWCDIIIWIDENRINNSFEKIIYTEAVQKTQTELKKAIELNLEILTYPEALAQIANNKKLIAIAWTHGKSTTTSLTSLVLKNSEFWVNAVIWTILKEFGQKNTYFSDSEYFVIEACEYKRSFLKYKPTVAVIVNIEIDHMDYYKDLDDYVSAYKSFLDNVVSGWFAILNWDDLNCRKLIWLRDDINYIEVHNDYFLYKNEIITFPKINMQIPWNHILFDAKLAYISWYMIWLKEKEIVQSLENYSWVWRRMEIIWNTENNNILMSDYGHHPTEIRLTLKALKDSYPAKTIITIFQPHQYNRTIELLEDFKTCFYDTDKLIVPDIYESRDNEEDKKNMTTEIFVQNIKHEDKINWKWLNNTLKLIRNFDKQNPNNSMIILMWAWDVDDLRYKIKTTL